MDKHEAIERLREAAFTVDDPESSDHGRTLIHCFGSFCGADWDVTAAIAEVEAATAVEWKDHLFGHDLAVQDSNGKVWHFDVKRG